VTVTYRPATQDDDEHIRWALYTALAWNPDRALPPLDETLEHPEAARYHRDWGRAGDFGVVATEAGEVAGIAYCRLFTEGDHGYGFVDEATPEVAIGIRSELRGRGLGTELLTRLAEAARARGFERLSLSVAVDNPARRLYERLGYRTVSVDGDGVRMVVDLVAS
jgi:ribosomal protein S18 acetylase RimI-like enzyme